MARCTTRNEPVRLVVITSVKSASLHAHQEHIASDAGVGNQHLNGAVFRLDGLEGFVDAVGVTHIRIGRRKNSSGGLSPLR